VKKFGNINSRAFASVNHKINLINLILRLFASKVKEYSPELLSATSRNYICTFGKRFA
jgi:hypothetical protein